MKKYFAMLFVLVAGFFSASYAKELDLEEFGKAYFEAMVLTQKPEATEQDIEKYLSLLTDDVGHQHFPNDPDDSREADNKKHMRKGMNYYRGANTEFNAELLGITTGEDVVVLKYKTSLKGFHPQLKKEISFSAEQVEVLEIEGGKVSVIRKYSKSL